MKTGDFEGLQLGANAHPVRDSFHKRLKEDVALSMVTVGNGHGGNLQMYLSNDYCIFPQSLDRALKGATVIPEGFLAALNRKMSKFQVWMDEEGTPLGFEDGMLNDGPRTRAEIERMAKERDNDGRGGSGRYAKNAVVTLNNFKQTEDFRMKLKTNNILEHDLFHVIPNGFGEIFYRPGSLYVRRNDSSGSEGSGGGGGNVKKSAQQEMVNEDDDSDDDDEERGESALGKRGKQKSAFSVSGNNVNSNFLAEYWDTWMKEEEDDQG